MAAGNITHDLRRVVDSQYSPRQQLITALQIGNADTVGTTFDVSPMKAYVTGSDGVLSQYFFSS